MSSSAPFFSLRVSMMALSLAISWPGFASQQLFVEEEFSLEQPPNKRQLLSAKTQKDVWAEKQRLSLLILEAVQGEPNEVERAQRCLKAFLDKAAFPQDLLAAQPLLNSLAPRLLQPEDIILQDQKAYLLFDPVLTSDHDALESLTMIIKDLADLTSSMASFLPASLNKVLVSVQAHYKTYLDRLLTPGADRPALLHPKALISGEGLFEFEGIRSYRISQDTARALLSKDQYGLFLKGNKSGSHAVCHKGSVYFKGNTTNTGLRVGLESASYLLSQGLFGRGMAPSALLTLQDVEIKTLPQQSPARGAFALACAQGQTSAEFFRQHPQYQREFTESASHHLLQASQEVKGIPLDTFLQEERSFQTLCRESFSEQVILSLLLTPSDGTPGNFMVQQGPGKADRLVGIDNDMAFGPSVVQAKIKRQIKHSIEVKNVLYCLPLMEEAFSAVVRLHLLSLSPEQTVLQWLAHLQGQENKYQSLTTSCYQKKYPKPSLSFSHFLSR